MEAQIISQGVDVHLSNTLGIVACPAQLSGQGVGIIPGNQVLIAHPARVGLGHTGIKACPGGNTGGACGVGVGIADTLRGQCVQEGRFHIRMPGNAQTVAPELVCHQQNNIGSLLHIKNLHNGLLSIIKKGLLRKNVDRRDFLTALFFL